MAEPLNSLLLLPGAIGSDFDLSYEQQKFEYISKEKSSIGVRLNLGVAVGLSRVECEGFGGYACLKTCLILLCRALRLWNIHERWRMVHSFGRIIRSMSLIFWALRRGLQNCLSNELTNTASLGGHGVIAMNKLHKWFP